MPEAITVHFDKYARVPKRDPISHHPIPEPTPEEYDVSKYEYVEVPEFDIFGKPFQGAAINNVKFERGKTYFLEPEYAAELRRILAMAQKADMRILQSHPDAAAPVRAHLARERVTVNGE